MPKIITYFPPFIFDAVIELLNIYKPNLVWSLVCGTQGDVAAFRFVGLVLCDSLLSVSQWIFFVLETYGISSTFEIAIHRQDGEQSKCLFFFKGQPKTNPFKAFLLDLQKTNIFGSLF